MLGSSEWCALAFKGQCGIWGQIFRMVRWRAVPLYQGTCRFWTCICLFSLRRHLLSSAQGFLCRGISCRVLVGLFCTHELSLIHVMIMNKIPFLCFYAYTPCPSGYCTCTCLLCMLPSGSVFPMVCRVLSTWNTHCNWLCCYHLPIVDLIHQVVTPRFNCRSCSTFDAIMVK